MNVEVLWEIENLICAFDLMYLWLNGSSYCQNVLSFEKRIRGITVFILLVFYLTNEIQ